MEPQVVLTVPLLVGLDGSEKMSKSLGNHIALEDPPREYFGKTMSIPDNLMWDWYLLLTDLPEAEIETRKAKVETGELHPKTVKEELAFALTADYHGEEAAKSAAEEFRSVFSGGGVPDEVPVVELSGPLSLPVALLNAELATSKNEARRLIQQGAVTIDGQRIDDPFHELAPSDTTLLVKVGKRRFARLQIRAE